MTAKVKEEVQIAQELEESKMNTISVFEDIRTNNDIVVADPEKLKIPLATVFGRGTTTNLPSFGGRTLSENTQLVDAAMKNVGQLENIWNHSHSQWTWKHINFSYHSPIKNMRQISAEMTKKKTALSEAKWRHVKNEAKICKLQDELQDTSDMDYWREVELKIKLAELKEKAVESMTYIEGAMKDVLALQEIYEDLKEKVSEFSEQDVELLESKTHMKRSLVQCIRDIRQAGHISKGEQEYVEQIGVNVGKLQHILKKYVESEASQESWDSSGLFEFVDKLADELITVHKVDVKRMELLGYDPDPTEEITYNSKLALPKSSQEEE